MLKQIYPVIGDEKDLPFYVVGIGIESWQFPIKRAEGYDYPQLFVTRTGDGEIVVNGETVRIVQNSVFYIPPDCPHEYHAVTGIWSLDWICFSGTDVIALIEK